MACKDEREEKLKLLRSDFPPEVVDRLEKDCGPVISIFGIRRLREKCQVFKDESDKEREIIEAKNARTPPPKRILGEAHPRIRGTTKWNSDGIPIDSEQDNR